jgi:hypothetical protein
MELQQKEQQIIAGGRYFYDRWVKQWRKCRGVKNIW